MEDRRPGKNKGFFEKISEGFGHVFGMNREEPEKNDRGNPTDGERRP